MPLSLSWKYLLLKEMPPHVTAEMIRGYIQKIRAFNQDKVKAQTTNSKKEWKGWDISLSINKIMCSKCTYMQRVVKEANLLPESDSDGRLLYDRHLENHKGGKHTSQQDMQARHAYSCTTSAKQVLLTLTDFNAGTTNDIQRLAESLQASFGTMVAQVQLPDMQGKSRKLHVSLKDHRTGLMTAEEEAVAEYFCKTLISQQMEYPGGRLAGIHFSSSFHHMLPSELHNSMVKLCIKDQQQAPGHEPGPED